MKKRDFVVSICLFLLVADTLLVATSILSGCDNEKTTQPDGEERAAQPPPVIEGAKMYWTELGTARRIRRANLDGTNVEDILTELASPYSIAIDANGGKMYWIHGSGIRRANLDGTNVEDIIPRNGLGGGSYGIAVNKGKIYWTLVVAHGIRRANLDGTNVEDIFPVLTVSADSVGIAVDSVGGKIYWTEGGPGTYKIRRANLDGTNVEDIVTEPASGPRIAIDANSGKIYWASRNRQIRRADLDGTNIEMVVTGVNFGAGLGGIAINVVEGRIYWVQQSEIRRANLDGTNVEDIVTGLSGPIDVALYLPVKHN